MQKHASGNRHGARSTTSRELIRKEAVDIPKLINKRKHIRGATARQEMTQLINNMFDKKDGGKLVVNTDKPYSREAFTNTQTSSVDQWHEGIFEIEALQNTGSKFQVEGEVREGRVRKLGLILAVFTSSRKSRSASVRHGLP